jgi:hypothetical protein
MPAMLHPHLVEKHICQLSCRYVVRARSDLSAIRVEDFNTPPGYNFPLIDVLLPLPEDYPASPPGVGNSHVYVPVGLLYHGRKPNDYHDYMASPPPGYAWWCYEKIDWDPCKDNLITFFEMLRMHMSNPI